VRRQGEIEIRRVVAEAVAGGAERQEAIVTRHESRERAHERAQRQLGQSHGERDLKAAVLPEEPAKRVLQSSTPTGRASRYVHS
jgi:hypothetical protein